MRKNIMTKVFLGFLFTIIFSNFNGVLAASCPCCGQKYGASAPGDEARISAIRRAHEASCCSRGSSGSGSSGSGGYRRPDDSGWREQQRQEVEQRQRVEVERQRLKAEQRQREEEEKRQKLKEAEAEEEAKRLKEIAKRKFNEDKITTLNSLKGVSSISLKLKGRTNTLGLKRKANPDVVLDLPGKVTKRVTSPENSGKITTAWRQLYHAAWISGFAFKAARKGDIEETAFLAEQVTKAMHGERIAVQCPEVPAPTKPYAESSLERESAVVQFYQVLLQATEEQTGHVASTQTKIRDATVKQEKMQEKQKKVQKKIEEKRQEITRIEEEIKEIEQVAQSQQTQQPETRDKKTEEKVEPEAENTQVEEEREKKRRALDAAKAAMEAAMGADEDIKIAIDDITNTISLEEKKMANAQENIGRYEKMYNNVQVDPGKASAYLKDL